MQESIDAFGPLQDSMLVRPEVLPFLVRVTAVQANRKVQTEASWHFYCSEVMAPFVSQVRLTQVDFKQPQPTRLKLLQELHQRYQPLAQVCFFYFSHTTVQIWLCCSVFYERRVHLPFMHMLFLQSLPAKFLSSIAPNISAADSLLVHNPC